MDEENKSGGDHEIGWRNDRGEVREKKKRYQLFWQQEGTGGKTNIIKRQRN